MRIELKELSQDAGSDILEMLKEIGPGENGFQNSAYDLDETGFRDFLYLNINGSRGLDLAPQRVPQTIYWLVADNRPIGIGKVRHYLNESLRRQGGHIGFCIRPTERGKCYGNRLLGELLVKARERRIPRVMLTCDEGNIASKRVIEFNGGRLDKMEGGSCYYWIDLREDGLSEIHMDDYDELFAFWSGMEGMGLNIADSREKVGRFLIQNNGLSFCYVEDGVIVGTALCGYDGRRGYIYHVAVAQCHRGKGIGSMLVDSCLDKLRSMDIDRCHLFCFRDNEIGNEFWLATGWIQREDINIFTKIL